MSTRHLVDPELLPLLDLLPTRDLAPEHLGEARAMLTQRPVPAGIAPSTIVYVPGPEGAPDVALRLFRPAGATAPTGAILHIHGGGFVLGSAAMGDVQNVGWADRHGALVVSVDYRLAPETPFPGPIEDCYSALAWLFDQADVLSVDPKRIVVAGESAGGGLAAALALLARDRGLPPLAGQLLTYPMLDPASADSANAGVGEFVWNRGSNRFGWAALRGDGDIPAERKHHFAVAMADDLSGTAPACIIVGALDLFLDENLTFVSRLAHAGVPVELHVYPGAFHGFDVLPGTRLRRELEIDLDAALRRFLGAGS